ncbi:hypothetical protein GGR53DRAFT_99816 [Hypoxylon sp. FL1150]|nr:hypothetical protein GGR53DRAFT_99816 [Hypoxylon sp. FL1150]
MDMVDMGHPIISWSSQQGVSDDSRNLLIYKRVEERPRSLLVFFFFGSPCGFLIWSDCRHLGVVTSPGMFMIFSFFFFLQYTHGTFSVPRSSLSCD